MNINNGYKSYRRHAAQIQFYPELHTRLENENIKEWCIRHRKITGKSPGFAELRMSPFFHVVTPKCTTIEKYRWCISAYGLDGFMEYVEDYSHPPALEKLWIFNDDSDAVQFKLMWMDHQETELQKTSP